MTGKTRRPAVRKRAVGRCETVHGTDCGLTLEQSAESRYMLLTWRVGANGFPAVTMGWHSSIIMVDARKVGIFIPIGVVPRKLSFRL